MSTSAWRQGKGGTSGSAACIDARKCEKRGPRATCGFFSREWIRINLPGSGESMRRRVIFGPPPPCAASVRDWVHSVRELPSGNPWLCWWQGRAGSSTCSLTMRHAVLIRHSSSGVPSPRAAPSFSASHGPARGEAQPSKQRNKQERLSHRSSTINVRLKGGMPNRRNP